VAAVRFSKKLFILILIMVFSFFSAPVLQGEALYSQHDFSRPSFSLFAPAQNQKIQQLLIFYPGGRVDAEAYYWLGKELAPRGYLTAVVDMPLKLAVLAPNRARTVERTLQEEGWDWQGSPLIGGHSLGGAMAARFAANNPVGGLFLWAAYPPSWTDLTTADFPVLVIMAEKDGLATREEVLGGITQLPPSTRSHEITGGIHAFFGRYGPQRGDGQPLISREEQELEIREVMLDFLQENF